MKYLFPIIFLALLNFLASCQSVTQDARLSGLDADITKVLERYNAAGLSVAIVENDQVIYARGFGYRDFEQKLPVDEHTAFGIGSVTKAFTSAIIGKLNDEGKLNLDDRPGKYLPALEFHDKSADQNILIRHLMSHGAGIPVLPTECQTVFFTEKNADAFVPKLKYITMETTPVGEQFNYSNAMYGLIGVIGSAVSGNSWEDNISDMLFQPLEMSNSFCKPRSISKTDNVSKGYMALDSNIKSVLPEDFPERYPAGAIYSSVHDMSKWLRMWLAEGSYGGKEVLSKNYIQQASSPQQRMSPPNVSAVDIRDYGFGWMVHNGLGFQKVEHSGAISGYTSNVAFYPTKGVGIVVLSNQFLSSLPYEITNMIEDRMLDFDRTPSDTVVFNRPNYHRLQDRPIKMETNPDAPPSLDYGELVGQYYHPGFGTFEIDYIDGFLFAHLPFRKMRLTHQTENSFGSVFAEEFPRALSSSWLTFDFIIEDITLTGVSLNVDSPDVVFRKE